MSTSRLSYTSSPESGTISAVFPCIFLTGHFTDGEFCGDDTPRRSAQVGRSGDRGSSEASRLARASSDPSLARQDGTIKSEPGEVIPDYSQPPPYSTQPAPGQEAKRRSHGGDSKYGFPNKQGGGAEEFPPPPPQAAPPQSSGYTSGSVKSPDRYASLPPESASPPDKRSQSQPPGVVQGKGKKEAPGPVLPPKIDRQKKPSKKSAAERLFGRGGEKEEKRDSKETGLTNGDPVGSEESPVEKRSLGYDSVAPQENGKKNTFDSNSSSNFDSYNKHIGEVPGYGYNRSISQPPSQHYSGPRSVGAAPQNGGGDKFRYSDYKPLPPPKSSIYKPVPPPKPKPFSRSNSQPPSMTESNYMNGNYITSAQSGQSQGPESFHYHSSRVAMGETNGYATTNGYAPTNGNSPNGNTNGSNGYAGTSNRVQNGHAQNGHGPQNGQVNGQANVQANGHGNGVDEMDTNGDSGQGSSLDRDYSSYNGNGHTQYNGSGGAAGRDRYAAPPTSTSGQRGGQGGQGQYYYNLPRGQEGREAGEGASPRRRAPGDTLDLSNREYRGSAFELYKKPGYSFPSGVPAYGDVPR